MREITNQVIAALEKYLADDRPLFTEIWNALGGERADPSNHQGQIISDLIEKETEPLHPVRLIQYHLNLAACVISSGAGVRTAHDILSAMADDWSFVIERQRFLLLQPSTTAPQLKNALDRVRQHEVGALSELLDTAASSLNSKIPDEWRIYLERLGGRK